MRRWPALGLATAVALAAAVAGFNYRAHPAPAAPVDASLERSVRALEAELVELRQELAQARGLALAARRAPSSEAASALAETSADVAGSDDGEPPAAAQPARSGQEMQELLDIRFSGEDDDVAWSRHAREQTQTLLASRLGERARVSSLECRASLCRAEIEQPDESAHRAYLERLAASPPAWDGTLMASLVEEEGGVSTVVFLARPGTELLSDAELAEL